MTTFANGESGSSVRTKINAAIATVDRIEGYLEIASAAATTILDTTSAAKIRVTGTTTQTIVLPDVSTLELGWFYIVTNDSTGNVTVQSSGLGTIVTLGGGVSALIQCILVTGTTAASWNSEFCAFSAITGSGAVVRAGSPTLTGVLNAAAISASSYVKGGFTAHAAGTLAMALGTNKVVSVTPNATGTLTTTVSPAGSTATIIVNTSGVTSYTMTFGTGFKSQGTLATGTVTAKTFAISFVSDGTSMIETGRTVAM
jgi:hypothetical protein